MKIIPWVLALVLSGCVTMPGDMLISKSEFDGSTQVMIEPAWVCKDIFVCTIKLSLMRNTSMALGDVVLTAYVKEGESFAGGKNLKFNVDGEIVELASVDEITDFFVDPGLSNSVAYIPPVRWAKKRYAVNKDFIKKLLSAKRVVVRVDMQQEFVEGIFSTEDNMAARPAFQKFYQRAFQTEI